MPKDPKELKKEVENARSWCDKARDILKEKRKVLPNRKTKDWEDLDDELNLAEKLLKELQKNRPEKYAAAAEEFIKLGETAKLALENNNRELVHIITARARFLNEQMKLLSKGQDPTKELSGLLKLEQEEFEKALAKAEKQKLDLESLTAGTHKFLGQVPLHIGVANEHLRNKQFAHAVNNLGKVAPEYDAQIIRHQKYRDYQSKRALFRDDENELAIIEKINTKISGKPVRDLVIAADKAFGEFKYDEAAAKLKEADKAYAGLRKTVPKDDLKKADAYSDAKDKFEDSYKTQKEAINVAQTLRGAVDVGEFKADPTVVHHIESARKILNDARQKVDGTIDPAVIKSAEEELDKIPDVLQFAKDVSKKLETTVQGDVEAVKEWTQTLRAAENAYELIKPIPGSDAEQTEMFNLLGKAKAKIVTRGPLVTGHAAALAILKDYTKIIERAQKRYQEMVSMELPPTIAEEAKKTVALITEFEKHSPKFMGVMLRDELREMGAAARLSLQQAGQPKALAEAQNKALKALTDFQDRLKKSQEKLLAEKQQAIDADAAYKKQLQQLTGVNAPPGIYQEADRLARMARDADMVDHEWSRAKEKLDQAHRMLKEIIEYYAKFAEEWGGKQQKLEKMIELSKEMMSWPPLMSAANTLREDCEELQRDFVADFDYEACITAYGKLKLEERYQNLMQKSQGIPRGKELESLRKTLFTANSAVYAAASEARNNELWSLEAALEGISEPSKTELHLKLVGVEDDWGVYFKNPGNDGKDAIEKRRDDALNQILKIRKTCESLLKKPELLHGFQQKVKNDEVARHAPDRAEHISGLIDELEKNGQDVAVHRRGLQGILNSTKHTAQEKDRLLLSFESGIVKFLDQARKEHAKYVKEFNEKLDAGEFFLKDVKGRHKNFQPYHEKLGTDLHDLQRMLNSGDPELVPLVNSMFGEFQRNVKEVHPRLRKDEDMRYSEVEKKWTELSNLLGSGTDRIVSSRLPNTYERLYQELQEAIAVAKKSNPKTGLEALAKMEQPIADAVEKARKLDVEHSRFKERKRELENKWDEVKALAKIKLLDDKPETEKYYMARLSEADSIRHSETGMPQALKLLDDMEKMVNQILRAEDPRATLQELNGKYAQEQTMIKDLAAQFQKEKSAFGKLLEETKSLLEKRESTGEIRKADMKDSLEMLKSLESVSSSAGKVVKQYTAVIEKLPHKKKGAQPAPQLSKAQADFERARGMLAEATRTAMRLGGATMTTNVNISNDLKKVQKNWSDQAQLFTSAMTSAKKSVDLALAELKQTIGQEQGLSQTQYDKLEADGKQVGIVIDDMATYFRVDAFAKPFETLIDKTESDDVKKKKLAARETALRVMRQYRDDVLNHPVLVKLTDKQNPFEQAKLMAATGYLRAALKRVEIETLIGV